jgi:hypothetical protein
MIDEEKSTQLNPIYVWAIAEEYFTITQTCQLLRVSVNRIRSYIDRDEDPMPFRCFPGQTKGYFIHKDDLREWLMRNTVRLRTSTFSSMPRLSVSWVCMSCPPVWSGGGIPFGPPGGGQCKAEGHGWAGQSLRRHRERDVGGARDGVRGLPAGGPKGIEASLGGATGCRAAPGGASWFLALGKSAFLHQLLYDRRLVHPDAPADVDVGQLLADVE